MTKEEFLSIASAEYDNWKQSDSSDLEKVGGYEYEKRYVQLIDRIGQRTFQSSFGTLPSNPRKKNASNQARQD